MKIKKKILTSATAYERRQLPKFAKHKNIQQRTLGKNNRWAQTNKQTSILMQLPKSLKRFAAFSRALGVWKCVYLFSD